MGDLNAYSSNWGNRRTGPRGRIVESVVRSNNLIILNDGSPTRITPTSETTIVLTMCFPNLWLSVEWSVLNTQLNSDHCVIAIELESLNSQPRNSKSRYNSKRANWTDYLNHAGWKNIKSEVTESQTIEKFYQTIQEVAKDTIPEHKIIPYYPKTWWNEQLHAAKEKRGSAYMRYRKHKSRRNLIEWK